MSVRGLVAGDCVNATLSRAGVEATPGSVLINPQHRTTDATTNAGLEVAAFRFLEIILKLRKNETPDNPVPPCGLLFIYFF
jgi:hypothetical protein